MPIYKPSLLDKFKDFVNGLRSNWDAYEQHIADFEDHLNASVADDVHGLRTNVIVESGSNANGNYIKFGDGTMICYGRITKTIAIDIQFGGLYRNDNDILVITFPQSFYQPPAVSVINNGSTSVFFANQTAGTVSEIRLYALRPTSIANANIQLNWRAVGRWK